MLATASVVASSVPPAEAQTKGARFTGETPDQTIDAQKARAIAGPTDADRIAAIAVIAQLNDRGGQGYALKAIKDAMAGMPDRSEARAEAAVVARSLEPDEGTAAGAEKAKSEAGILTDVAVLGPFRDTGGGLEAHDGPEGKKSAAAFGDPNSVYSWGTVEVRWRTVPSTFAQARGIPLDLFVHPRKESCSWIASKITLDAKRSIIVRLGAAGTARLLFDGMDLDKSDDVHATMRFDRLAAKVEAAAGPHIVAAKICTGALEDSGRVRLRVTDDKGAPLKLTASADLTAKDTIPWTPQTGKAAPKGVAKVTTPLIATANGKGSPDALINAAIARSIAGADDEKSPRAPGQLDALLQDPNLDADRLAIAAWATESAANRSTRYYRARNAAVKANDPATIAFVDRRLVETHLESDTPDWAMASFRGAKLDQKTDPEALFISSRIAKGLRVEALGLRAARDLGATFRAGKDKVPNIIVYDLAQSAKSTDPKVWLEASEELKRRGIRGEVLVDAMGTKGKGEVEAAARDAFQGGMDDADEALSVAHHVVEAGGHELAAQLYRTIALWAPNRAEAWAGLAREVAAVGGSDPKASQTVLVALRRARELAPGDARYRSELAMRTSQPGREKTPAEGFHDDERYMVKSEAILARRKGVPQGAPDVADRELHWLRVVRMHPDNRVSQLIQYAREIVIPPRTQAELFEQIPPEGDLIEILKARVHRKNGTIAFPAEEHNDGNRPRIRWPELEAGDTVEVAVREWTSTAVGGRGDAPFYFMDYAGAPSSHPLVYNEVVVETLLPGPAGKAGPPLYVDVLNDKLTPYKREDRDEKDRGVHVLRLVWDKPLIVPEEPLAPHTSEVSPVIVGSTFQNWNDFRKWYGEAVRGFTEPDEEVRRMAAELTKGKKTREEKLRALFEFVADDIRYVNYVSGEWWLPNRPQQLLARREGDCDDKAMLLITLLRSVGIEAQEVMVQTRMTGQPGLLMGKNAAVPLFDHGIAYLPGQNGQPGQYLDATSPQSRLGPIPSMDARAVALRMDSGPAEIVQLPASSPDDHGSDVTWTVNVGADGSGDLTGEERHFGDAAFWLRSNLKEAEARAQYVEDSLVSPWFPTIDVDKNIDFKGELQNGQALVKYKAKSRGMARREGKDLVLPLSPAQTYGSQIAPLPTRTLPVTLPSYFAPSHQNRTLRAIAPAGMAWGDLPPGGDANGGDFGKAHIEIAKDPKDQRALIVKRSIVFNQHIIPVDKYVAWRTWVQQVDSLMHKEVRLVEAK